MKSLRLHSLICYFLVLCISATFPVSVTAQSRDVHQHETDVFQWLSGEESQELLRALDQLQNLVSLYTEAASDSENLIASLPQGFAGLFEDTSDFSQSEKEEHILFGSDSETGLLELTAQVSAKNIADYNKLILAGAVMYREYPTARTGLGKWFDMTQAHYNQVENSENSSMGGMIATGAGNGIALLVIARTALWFGRTGFIKSLAGRGQSLFRKLRPSVQGSQLALRTPNLPAVTANNSLTKIRAFFQTRTGMLALPIGAAAAGGATGGIQSYYLSLQTQRVSPLQSLQMIQADLACELAYGSLDLNQSLQRSQSSENLSWAEISDVDQLIESSYSLNQELSGVFPALVNLWTSNEKGWTTVRDVLENDLNQGQTEFSCSQISTEVISLDLARAKDLLLNIVRKKLESEIAATEPRGALEHREFFKNNFDWLILQDDLLAQQTWLFELVRGIDSELKGARP